MESCLPGCWAPAGPLPASWLLSWLLVPWALQLAGGQSVTVMNTGLPIVVSLANKAVSFGCRVTYQYTPEVRNFTVSYFHVDLQGQRGSAEQTACRPQPGTENQAHILDCKVTPRLPDASATGTYYCCVSWPGSTVEGNGTFILVRDTGYQPPPPSSQKALLLGFTGLLAVLSVLGTAALLWKKKRLVLGKHPTKTCPDPRPASKPAQPPAESVYTALQRRETEVYAYIKSEAGSPPSSRRPRSQEELHRFEDDSEFNMVYENL